MTNITREPNGNIKLTLNLSWGDILAQYEKEVVKAVEEAEIEGFRKGKAPRDLVEPRLDKTKLYSRSIEALLPDIYNQAVKDNNLRPILQPQVRLEKGEEGQDWEFSAITCEVPTVTIPQDYETSVKKIELKETDEKLVKIIDFLRSNSTVQIPDLLVEEEANHRLAALADNVTKLGMNLESYMQAKKITADELKAQTALEARADLEAEFILEEVRKNKDQKTRKETLDFLLSLI